MSLRVRISGYPCGAVHAGGVTHEHDPIIGHGKIGKRTKGASRKSRGAHRHTPRPAAQDLAWRCRRLAIGTGAERRPPAMNQVHDQARRREAGLVILPTAQATGVPAATTKHTNAIVHPTR